MDSSEMPAIHAMLAPGLAGSMNCTPVSTLGETIERLARPAMPARQPHTKPVIRDAIRGRLRRTATPYRAGSVVPAIRAEDAAASAV